jgi:hypothetical protein
MKTNHQRNYVDPGSFRWRFDLAGSNDFTNGHRGHARAVHGAKKRVRVLSRLTNKELTRRELKDYAESSRMED